MSNYTAGLSINLCKACAIVWGDGPGDPWVMGHMGHGSRAQWVTWVMGHSEWPIPCSASLTGGQPHFARCLVVSCAATLHIYFLGFLPPDRILPGAKFTLRPSLAFSYTATVTAWHYRSRRQPNFAALNRGRHLYSAGRPSGWALAHILVFNVIFQVC